MDDMSDGVPQFATAEFAPSGPAATCAGCKRPIAGPYFTINGVQACAECSSKIQAKIPQDSHAAFMRALVFGIGGAVAGFALYVIFALATGLVIGFVSLAVGFIVGKAMSFGSRGVGGRRYQIVAVLLTYLAVSLSAVLLGQHVDVAKAIGALALLGIASPFLDLQDPVHGIIGLVILFVGMRFAWRFTAGRTLDVSGPHTQTPSQAGVI